MFLIESKSKEWRDELYFQQKINEIYLSKKVLELCRNFYRNSIEENQFNLMKDSSITRKFRNLNSEHQKKIKESKYSCKVNSLVCKTLIEYNQTFKTNYYSFIFRPNPQMNFFIQDYFDLDSKQTQKNLIIEMLNDQNLFEHIKRNTLLIGRHHHICKEEIDCCPSPFSPFSPLTPDFSKIYSFNDKFNEYNQQETNQNFLKGYLKKSVIETRKSIGTSNFQKRKSQESKKIKEKSFFAKKSLESPQNPKSKRILTHCKTLDLDNEVRNNGRPPSIESKSGNLFLKLNFDSSDNESPIHKNLNSAIVYSTSHKLIDTKEKIIPKKFNFKKKKTGSFSNIEKNEENLNVTFMDDENESVDDNNDPLKIEPRTSLFLLQAKGVYNNINDVVVDKYINVIEKSDCINFTHEFFIERSKIL